MATTFYNYSASYVHSGGTKTWAGQSSGSVPVNYGGVRKFNLTSAKTLNTAGKLCNGTIQIGGNTLNCSGKVMNSNVAITMTKVYKWNRYASVATYSSASAVEVNVVNRNSNRLETYYYKENASLTIRGVNLMGINAPKRAFANYYPISLNTASGLYTITSNYYAFTILPTNSWMRQRGWGNGNGWNNGIAFYATQVVNSMKGMAYEYVYFNIWQHTGAGPNANTHYDHFEIGMKNTAHTKATYLFYGDGYGNSSLHATRYYTSVSYSRGSYQTQVSSTSASAYPANARHTDGYWYTAV